MSNDPNQPVPEPVAPAEAPPPAEPAFDLQAAVESVDFLRRSDDPSGWETRGG